MTGACGLVVLCPVAGLQFYDYWRDDGLGGRAVPAEGDRVSLVRQPDNAHDRRAIEVWWKNGVRLGHLPRPWARRLAPWMDIGLHVSAAIRDPGNGSAWSMTLALHGPLVDHLAALTAAENAAREVSGD